jgi:hypothetical protein
MERGQNHEKETPTEIGASCYCWQLALNTDPPVTKRCEEWSGQQQHLTHMGKAEIFARSIIKMGHRGLSDRIASVFLLPALFGKQIDYLLSV